MTHICVNHITIVGSDSCLSPNRRQAITWTNAGILLIEPVGTNFGEILIKIHIFSFKKRHLKTSSAKRRPFCLGLNVLTLQRDFRCIYSPGATVVTFSAVCEHDDVIKRKHFPRYWPFVRGIHRGLCGEFTGPRWIPRTKASDAELWCFLWSASE